MEKTISATDLSREFSRLLQAIRQGDSYIVTSNGEPVARLVPIPEDAEARRLERQRLVEMLRAQPAVDIGRWTREGLHEEGR